MKTTQFGTPEQPTAMTDYFQISKIDAATTNSEPHFNFPPHLLKSPHFVNGVVKMRKISV